jgi:preprotein translocase subunit SecB
MADKKNGNTPVAGAAETPPHAMQVQIVGQFIKDLSFENPNISKLLDGPGENPNLKLEVNVNAERAKTDLYQSTIDFKAHATNKDGTIYIMECVYGGLFRLQNVPEQTLEPFLLVNCPTILFPFLRRLVADITREGGFPPLMLDPIDFGHLYVRRQQEIANNAPKAS